MTDNDWTIVLSLIFGLEIPVIPIAYQFRDSFICVLVFLGWQIFLIAFLEVMKISKRETLAEAKEQFTDAIKQEHIA
jgi:hypothetical protein